MLSVIIAWGENVIKDKVNGEIFHISETSVLVQFENEISEAAQLKVKAFADYLDENPFEGMVEYIPSFTSVTVFYDPMKLRECAEKEDKNIYQAAEEKINKILEKVTISNNDEFRVVEIPVCYGGEFGPDLEFVAEHNKLSKEEVIKLHSEGEYIVYMIGFAPGFPYLGGMSEKIAAPRRKTPRTIIPKGSVGIAGSQTGVYPISTPGGWQLIGRTPVELFRPKEYPPSLLRAGDKVKFKPISYEEYKAYGEGEA